MDTSKQLENELALAAVKAGIMPMAKHMDVRVTGFIAGINLAGEAIAVFGHQINDEPAKIVVNNMGDAISAAEQLNDADFRDMVAKIMAKKLTEE